MIFVIVSTLIPVVIVAAMSPFYAKWNREYRERRDVKRAAAAAR
ncbi:hypothetical protein [Microbacterium indicum]|nr:hypothetical protein [Microbacterium indicum]